MKRISLATCALAGVFFLASNLFAQSDDAGAQGRVIVTVLPAHSGQAVAVPSQDLAVKVAGKQSTVTGWTSLRDRPVELVLLIDTSARSSLGTQLGEISSFVKEMPPNTKMTIAYMENGRAVLGSPLSSNPAEVLKGLHLPAGPPGISGSPYFCLSDLAKNWPSQDRGARREVMMITDGVDNYEVHYDPEDPYVQASIQDSVRAGLVVYSIFWQGRGSFGRSGWAANSGQNLMLEVTQATGGYSYWEGFGNPVNLQPYLQDLRIRLRNQYELSFTAPVKGKAGVQSLKVNVASAKVDAPQQVYIRPATEG